MFVKSDSKSNDTVYVAFAPVITAKRHKALWESSMGYVTVRAFDIPPWVQVGNDADPDKRNGSFTENRQIWKRCPDAG